VESEVGGACGTHVEERKAYEVLVGKPEGKRAPGRPRHRWENGIRMDFRETDWGGVEWIHLIRGRWRALVNTYHLSACKLSVVLKSSEGDK
jgi:hypothetical protein